MTDLAKIQTVWGGVAGTPYYSTMYFDATGGVGVVTDAQIAVDTFWTAISGNLVNSLTWTVIGDIPIIDDATGTLVGNIVTTDQTGAGASATEQVPRTVQGLVQWRTNTILNGRRLRGRTFVPGYVEAANTTGGVILPASAASLETAADALIADSGNELRIYSRTHATSAPVAGADVWAQWATLMSRRD